MHPITKSRVHFKIPKLYVNYLMGQTKRFQDQNLTLSDFYDEVCVVCPGCAKKALAKTDRENKTARLFCSHCEYNKTASTAFGTNGNLIMAASAYFDAKIWYQATFKNEVLWACNLAHLTYLQSYIASGIRENKDRNRFTLVEKLPKFMQIAKNREALLKLIYKLKQQ